ncbi:MAG: hypothetical protein MHM6MM_004679 [Cercozoa sp. M6MM]
MQAAVHGNVGELHDFVRAQQQHLPQLDVIWTITCYNESAQELAESLVALQRAIRFACSQSDFGVDYWKRVLILVVFDGDSRTSDTADSFLQSSGLWPSSDSSFLQLCRDTPSARTNHIHGNTVLSDYEGDLREDEQLRAVLFRGSFKGVVRDSALLKATKQHGDGTRLFTDELICDAVVKDSSGVSHWSQQPLQVLTVRKRANRGKLHSHFVAFGSVCTAAVPRVVCQMDVGSWPMPGTLVGLRRLFHADSAIGFSNPAMVVARPFRGEVDSHKKKQEKPQQEESWWQRLWRRSAVPVVSAQFLECMAWSENWYDVQQALRYPLVCSGQCYMARWSTLAGEYNNVEDREREFDVDGMLHVTCDAQDTKVYDDDGVRPVPRTPYRLSPQLREYFKPLLRPQDCNTVDLHMGISEDRALAHSCVKHSHRIAYAVPRTDVPTTFHRTDKLCRETPDEASDMAEFRRFSDQPVLFTDACQSVRELLLQRNRWNMGYMFGNWRFYSQVAKILWQRAGRTKQEMMPSTTDTRVVQHDEKRGTAQRVTLASLLLLVFLRLLCNEMTFLTQHAMLVAALTVPVVRHFAADWWATQTVAWRNAGLVTLFGWDSATAWHRVARLSAGLGTLALVTLPLLALAWHGGARKYPRLTRVAAIALCLASWTLTTAFLWVSLRTFGFAVDEFGMPKGTSLCEASPSLLSAIDLDGWTVGTPSSWQCEPRSLLHGAVTWRDMPGDSSLLQRFLQMIEVVLPLHANNDRSVKTLIALVVGWCVLASLVLCRMRDWKRVFFSLICMAVVAPVYIPLTIAHASGNINCVSWGTKSQEQNDVPQELVVMLDTDSTDDPDEEENDAVDLLLEPSDSSVPEDARTPVPGDSVDSGSDRQNSGRMTVLPAPNAKASLQMGVMKRMHLRKQRTQRDDHITTSSAAEGDTIQARLDRFRSLSVGSVIVGNIVLFALWALFDLNDRVFWDFQLLAIPFANFATRACALAFGRLALWQHASRLAGKASRALLSSKLASLLGLHARDHTGYVALEM